MQTRDTAEELIKTLVLIAVADLVANGGRDRQLAARKLLFAGLLSLGGWRAVLVRLSQLGAEVEWRSRCRTGRAGRAPDVV